MAVIGASLVTEAKKAKQNPPKRPIRPKINKFQKLHLRPLISW